MELTNINEDSRGFIKTLVGDLQTAPEVTIFKTRAGMARGGCIHSRSVEHLVVIEGIITYICGEEHLAKTLEAGQSVTIGANIPHYYISMTDSIVMEWGPQIDEKQAKHDRFRKIVLDINTMRDNYDKSVRTSNQ